MAATSPAKNISPSNSFLFLRGRIFYFRRRTPQKLVASGYPREIRICLHTSYQAMARKLALHLYAMTEQMQENWQIIDANDLDAVNAASEAFRAMCREEVKRILATQPKSPIALPELQRRMNSYLRQQLDEDMANTELPPYAEHHEADNSVKIYTVADACADKAKELQSELLSGKNYGDHYERALIELTRKGIIDPSEITEENAELVTKIFMMMQVKLYQIISARYSGDYALEQQLCPSAIGYSAPPQQVDNVNSENIYKSISLSELIEKYIKTNLDDGRWKEHSIADHRSRLTSLGVIIGDKSIDKYTRDDIRKFRNTLLILPRNWRKIYNQSSTTIEAIIEAGESAPKLAPKTVNVHVEAISSMFSWAIQEGLITVNPAMGLAVKDEQPDIDKREAFTREDIKNIFFSGDYEPINFKKPSYYWCPLISLYTGMRLEEICQLHIEDIHEDDGLYIIDISKESTDGLNDKILKTANAIRKVPIHKDLIKLGLIAYRNTLEKKGEIRLFPELNKTDSSPKYGKQVGKKFSELVAKKGITGNKSFHSLRHTFSDFFKKLNLHTDMFTQVFGHGQTKLAARQYGSRFTPKEIYDKLICLLDFNEQKNT